MIETADCMDLIDRMVEIFSFSTAPNQGARNGYESVSTLATPDSWRRDTSVHYFSSAHFRYEPTGFGGHVPDRTEVLPSGWAGISDPAQHLAQPAFRIDALKACHSKQGADGSRTLATSIGTTKEIVLRPRSDGAKRPNYRSRCARHRHNGSGARQRGQSCSCPAGEASLGINQPFDSIHWIAIDSH